MLPGFEARDRGELVVVWLADPRNRQIVIFTVVAMASARKQGKAIAVRPRRLVSHEEIALLVHFGG